MTHFSAPWGRALRWISVITTVVCIGVAATDFFLFRSVFRSIPVPGINLWAPAVPVILLLGAAPFTIRGYSISNGVLLIHRLWWDTRVSLAGLMSAEALPNAMRRSIRLCGNGGLYSFTGWYRSKDIGNYRAFVTDLTRTVVLRLPNRTLVLSPDNADTFVAALKPQSGLTPTTVAASRG